MNTKSRKKVKLEDVAHNYQNCLQPPEFLLLIAMAMAESPHSQSPYHLSHRDSHLSAQKTSYLSPHLQHLSVNGLNYVPLSAP